MTFLFRRAGFAAALVFTVTAVVVAVCLFNTHRSSGKEAKQGANANANPANLVTVTDLLGRQVQVRIPVQRAILGEGRQLYLVAALDTDNPLQRIVGWHKDLMEADPDTYALYRQKFPHIAELSAVGGFEDGSFSIEKAIALQPDVIILNMEARAAADDAGHTQKLAALGIPVVYIDFRHYPMQNTEPTMRMLGRLFGKEARAEEFIAFRADQIRRVTEVIAQKQPPRPKVFVERIGGYTEDCCLSFGNENFGRFVEMAGGTNIARDLIHGTFGQLSPEQIIAVNPDQVVVTSANWDAYVPNGKWIGVGPGADLTKARRKLEAYTLRPAYTGIRATQERQFHAIWHQFYNSPYQFAAIQQLAKWFHPSLFAGLDPDAGLRELHERFLPIDYRPGYFVSLAGDVEDRP